MKKAQITIFILLAVVIIAVVGAILYLTSDEPETEDERNLFSKEILFGVDAGIDSVLPDSKERIEKMQEINVEISRANFVDFQTMDNYILELQKKNIELLLKFELVKPNIGLTYSIEDFEKFVSEVVERYDNDGFEDMPGLKMKVEHYEIGNEPSMKVFFPGTTEKYFEYLKAGYNGVKKSCKECLVLNGGLFDSEDTPVGDVEDYKDYFETLLELGAEDYFDILSVHIYHLDGSDWGEMIPYYKSKTNKPIWVTETGWSSEEIFGVKSSEKKQAEEIVFRIKKMAEQGVEAVFIFTLQDIPNKEDVFKNFGMFNKNGKAKLAAQEYKNLAEKFK